ncbi:neuronal acetylcholine receptor subunit alpha-7 [Plakobranchus ocellatus]|uniref:Neuronal acetylcholine receptor subunit alpha-7 n=1 Tax=Plakobranchus ocellatus TaxID=259542 RepID=A0AAV3ZCF9_9GAST|nr:neuronal acetylcholine receptor subunit alpha-7 [Plakobranchus ocellatus]
MSRLLDKIFHGYKPAVLPRINNSRPVEVQVGLGIIAVVELTWRDQLLHWEPSDYGNITHVILSQNAIWKPDITLVNSLQQNIYVGGDEVLLRLNYNGVISWQPAFYAGFTCEVDVTKYPMDVNICRIRLGAWMHDESSVHLEPMGQPTVLEPGIKNGQFHIEVVTPINTVAHYDGELYRFLYFGIKLHRRASYVFLSMLLPMFVIGLLNIVSFIIPADNEGKVDLSLNILLSTTVFIGVCHDDLPDRSDKISSIAVYVISLFVLSFLGVLGNTIVLLVHQHEESKQSRDAWSPTSTSTSNHTHDPGEDDTSDPFKQWNNLIPYAEKAPQTRDTPSDQSEATSATPVIAVISASKAARLNLVFLVFSTFGLMACSGGVLLQMLT